MPGDPFTTHTINVLHLLLPAGERWFIHVYRQVLPYIHDSSLRYILRMTTGVRRRMGVDERRQQLIGVALDLFSRRPPRM
ncbi:hypothetical protein SMICM304S_02930 [Streptomyces microflavus]